jgi:hypothetical protein
MYSMWQIRWKKFKIPRSNLFRSFREKFFSTFSFSLRNEKNDKWRLKRQIIDIEKKIIFEWKQEKPLKSK